VHHRGCTVNDADDNVTVTGHGVGGRAATHRTGKIGDGKFWVTEAVRVVRIRTGEVDVDVL
jgi:nitrogen regulatory protein PII